MDVITTVVSALGDAVNGVLQVITDFLNLVISVLPNPDPFPELIEGMPDSAAADMGFVRYWLDAFIGIDYATGVLMAWSAVMVAGAVFAVVYWVVKAIKP